MEMPTLYVIDIDGTIACHAQRAINAGPCPGREQLEAYKAWVAVINTGMEEDLPISGMKNFINSLSTNGMLIYLTNRGDQHRQATETWLSNNGFPEAPLYMRDSTSWNIGDGEYKESEIKKLLSYFPDFSVVVLDDDPKGEIQGVCNKNGWTFLKAFGKAE